MTPCPTSLQAGDTEQIPAAGYETQAVNGCVKLGRSVMCLVYVYLYGVGGGRREWVCPGIRSARSSTGPLLRSLQVPRCIGARGTLRLWHLQTPDPLFLGR